MVSARDLVSAVIRYKERTQEDKIFLHARTGTIQEEGSERI